VKVLYRQTAGDDIVRQFRYYLVTAEAPEIALRFREAVRRTIQSLSQNPHVGPPFNRRNKFLATAGQRTCSSLLANLLSLRRRSAS
jgi:plasmid stabilization system protein ParE